MWKSLDHPWVSRAGNFVFLAGLLQAVIRLLMGLSLASAVTVVLIAIGVALMVIPYVSRRRSAQPIHAQPDLSSSRLPEAKSSKRVYGSAAIRQAISEIAEDKDRELIIAEFVTMIEEGKRLRDCEFTGELTWHHFDQWWRGITGFVGEVLGEVERQRLIEIEPAGAEPQDRIDAVMGWLRERRDHSDRWTPQLWGDELAAALRERRSATRGKLADQLDDMIREGRELVTELSAPIQPEKTGWVARVVGGDPPAEWQEKADAFRQRALNLLEERNPALLPDYRDGCNDFIRRERELDGQSNLEQDGRSDAEKALALANAERSGPRREVEACLEGLATARKAGSAGWSPRAAKTNARLTASRMSWV